MTGKGNLSRRAWLQSGFAAAIGAATTRLAVVMGREPACEGTPPQTAGPFYPTVQGADEDMDLTRVAGSDGRAEGELLYVRGTVLDEQCRPVADALVEIWQANRHGRYHHERDDSPAPLDPRFQGWGEVLTGADGRYGFKTVIPGAYGAGAGMRTPHIHFRIARRGYHELITQMYFDGQDLNPQDGLWAGLSEDDRARVTIALEPGPDDGDPGGRLARFDIVLRPVS